MTGLGPLIRKRFGGCRIFISQGYTVAIPLLCSGGQLSLIVRRLKQTVRGEMANPAFVEGRDCTTFAPFVLIDCRDTEWNDIRLEFSDHAWTAQHVGSENIGDCYLNGYGIQGLVFAARVAAGLDPIPPGVEPDSEGDTCYIHFADLQTAVETATLAREMINDPSKREQCAKLAVEEGLDDL
jgi:hypothetical protein